MKLYEITINPESISKSQIDKVVETDEFYNYSDLIIEYIQKNCQPWLEESDYIAFRGIKNSEGMATLVKTVRQDRKPRDSSEYFQLAIDEMLEKTGFTALRRNSVFVTQSLESAMDYGDIYMIFPIGDFTYTWNIYHKDLMDFYSDSRNMKYVDFEVTDEMRKDFIFSITDKFLRNIEMSFERGYGMSNMRLLDLSIIDLKTYVEKVQNLYSKLHNALINTEELLIELEKLFNIFRENKDIQTYALKKSRNSSRR